MTINFSQGNTLWQFSSPTDNSSPGSVTFGDIDRDGDQDAFIGIEKAAGNQSSMIFKNDGSGNFSLYQTLTPMRVVKSWLVNIDGDADLELVTRSYDAPLSIYQNNGSGSFSSVATTSGHVNDAEIADIDNDGDLDIVTALKNGGYQIYKNNGTGQFNLHTTVTGPANPYNISLADLDKDGDLDIVAIEEDNGRILLNDGKGNFTPSSSFGNVYGTFSDSVDVNGDGYADILVNNINSHSGDLLLYINNGSGGLGTLKQTFTSEKPWKFADIDGDGDLDGIGNTILLNDGTGSFSSTGVKFNVPTMMYDGSPLDGSALAAADIDGDGDEDLAVIFSMLDWNSYIYSAQASIFVNNSSTPTNTDGTLSIGTGFGNLVSLHSTIDSANESIDVFDFRLSDGGSSDGVAMGVSKLIFHTSGTGDFSKVTWRINGPDANNLIGVYNNSENTITFSGLAISVANGGNETYKINAYYNNTNGLINGQQFILSIDGDTDVTTASSGTRMASNQTAVTSNPIAVSVNNNPTLTTINHVVGATEDTQKEISFADLQGLANEADADGTVVAFVVRAVSSGSLKIGADAASATAWNATTNAVVDASKKAFWTPAADANGDLNAFTVVARDDQGADSATPVTVVVATQSVNDAPRIDKLNGDAGSFTPGIPQYIDAQPTLDDAALILDDNANFAGGYLRVQQTSGATDGRFYFYGELLSAGSNITTISIGGKVIGQVDALEDGQNGRPLTIRLNADATHANGLNDLLGYLQYTADSAGSRSFSLVLNDGALDSSPVTFSLNGLGVTNVTSSTANGTYKVGDVVSIQLTFSDTVTVTGTPSLTLETGTTDRTVNYASGSGSTTLTFNYTVQAGDTSSDLDYLASSALALNGGSIRNADDLDVALTLPQPGATASLGHNKAILIDGLAPSDIALSNAALTTSGGINATVGALTSTDATVGDTFTYSLVSGSGDTSNALFNIAGNTLRANDAGTLSAGTHSVRVRTTDAAGNTYEEALNLTVTSNPTVTLSSDKATLKAGETATITFTFSSEPVGFAADDIVVTGGSLSSLSGSGTVYTATFTPQANAQNIGASLSVAANTFSDGALNNAASNTLSLTGDTNIPTLLSIARQTPADAQTNADSLTWRLTFSEAVTGLDASDFSVGGTSATVTSVSGSGSTWDVTVSGGDLAAYNGTATLALAGGHDLADAAGNPLTQNTPSGSNESYTLDNEAPLAPTLSLSADTGPSDSDGVTKNGSVIVGGLEAGASWQYSTDGGLSWSTGSGNSFVLSAGTYAANAVQARQTDGAGNVSSVGSHATGITVDTHVPATPSLSLSSDTGSSNGDGFSTQGAIVVGGLENGANWEYSTDGGLNWSTGSGNGFTLGEGSYASGKVLVRQSDIAGNTSANGSNTQSIEIDTTAPTLGDITRGNLSSPASNSPFTVQVSFADSGSGIDASTLDAGDITLTGPGSVGTLSVSSVSYDSNTHTATYTVAAPGAGWSSASHAGTYTVAVNADQVRDLAGNAVAANAAAHTFKVSFNSVEIPITQGAFNGRSVTLVTDEGLNIVQASNAGATGLPRSLKLPLGNFAFEIEGLANGATANLSMIVDPDMQSLAYYKKDNADKWVNLTKAVTYLNNGKVKIDFQLTDGGAFDRDALANGRIQDPGGLGFNALTPFVREGTTAVAAVGFDDDAATFGVTLQYAITGGADAAAFDIDPISGALSFKQAPSFAAPTDLGDGAGNNTYQVEITASGGTASAEPRLVTVTVLSETGSNAIVAGNPAPVFTNVPGTTQSLNVGSIAQLPDFTVSDTDSAELTLTLTATNGTIGGLVDMDPNTAGIQLVGSPSHITTQLAAATFTSQSAGAASITLSASDAVNDPVIVTYNLNVAAPSSPEPTPKPDPIIPPRDSWTDLPDNDGDGIPEQVENLVPSLGGGVAGDGNGDGIPDIQQSEVASVPFRNTQQVSQDPDAPVVFVTLVGGSENGVPRSESSVKITSAQQLDAPADKPADLAMPLGLIGFTAVAASSGSTETFSLLIDGDIAINGYWKQNTQGTWVNLASAEYGGRVVTENGKTRLDFTITDGGQFDDDGKADGIISDPGAPGWFGSADSDKDQFPDTLEAQNGLSVGTKDNDVFTSSKFFVMQLYRDIHGREADQEGLLYWQQKIDSGTLDRAQVASAVLDSAEFQAGAGAIARLYFGALDRLPDNDGLHFWRSQLQENGTLSRVPKASPPARSSPHATAPRTTPGSSTNSTSIPWVAQRTAMARPTGWDNWLAG